MNKFLNKFGMLASLAFQLFSITLSAQDTGTLTIEASGFENEKGVAVVNLFRETDDLPKQFYLQTKAPIVNGKAVFTLSKIPYAAYAAIAFHDENANEILDHKFGFPNEPMGFSNNWRLTLFSGMPGFEKMKFRFDKDQSAAKISVK